MGIYCLICKQVFFSNYHLSIHYRHQHHTKSYNQICGICDAAFFVKSNLLKHMREQHIPQVFDQSTILNFNLQQQQHNQYFWCDYCGLGVKRKYNLKKHIIRFHAPSSSSSPVITV